MFRHFMTFTFFLKMKAERARECFGWKLKNENTASEVFFMNGKFPRMTSLTDSAHSQRWTPLPSAAWERNAYSQARAVEDMLHSTSCWPTQCAAFEETQLQVQAQVN